VPYRLAFNCLAYNHLLYRNWGSRVLKTENEFSTDVQLLKNKTEQFDGQCSSSRCVKTVGPMLKLHHSEPPSNTWMRFFARGTFYCVLSKTRYSTNGCRQETFFFLRVLELRERVTLLERFLARVRRFCVWAVELRRFLRVARGDDARAGLRSRARSSSSFCFSQSNSLITSACSKF